jgi:hypothetical protein
LNPSPYRRGSFSVRDDRTDAAPACTIAIGFSIVSFISDSSARRDVGSEIEKNLEVAAVTGFAAGQMKGQRQAAEIDLQMDFR